MTQNNQKKAAAIEAAKYIKNGMCIGVGTGSTVFYFIEELENLIKLKFSFTCVSSSNVTNKLLSQKNIPLVESDKTHPDLYVDGADIVFNNYTAVKGLGGALVREKILRTVSSRFICIIDESKHYTSDDTLIIPVEIIPFLYLNTVDTLASFSKDCVVRTANNSLYKSDNSNYIVDVTLDTKTDLEKWHSLISTIPGVVDTGIFLQPIDIIITGKQDGKTITQEYSYE